MATKKSVLSGAVVFILAILFAIIGYCVYDYFNEKYFAGVYPLGKLVALTAGFIPVMVWDVFKTKKVTSAIFPMLLFVGVFAWFYATLPDISYSSAADELEKKYDSVVVSTESFEDDAITEEKIPGYYNGAYIFEAEKDSVGYYIIMNPKDGKTYEYEAEKNLSFARYFD